MSVVPPNPETFSVKDAWKPLPESLWNQNTAAHYLRRFGFSATPVQVEEALWSDAASLTRTAIRRRNDFKPSRELEEFMATAHQRQIDIYRNVEDREERQRLQREFRQENYELLRQYCREWFVLARNPDYGQREKLVLFLQNVFVVQRSKVWDTGLLFQMQQTLREGLTGSYPDLCKAVNKEPAMIQYLDLHLNRRDRPNENFVREFFELFTLGEGNYTEEDVKEATRAFTDYRVRNRYQFFQDRRARDQGQKTVFDKTGNWHGDDIVDLTFQQPAARVFFVRQLVEHYLNPGGIPEEYVEELGRMWANRQYDLTYLFATFFQGQLFYHPAYRGTLVKSPVQFYIGLCQDLGLSVIPFPHRLMRTMDVMGQSFYNPPNVRGWLQGEHWINSNTINARRQLVTYLFGRIQRDRLNANELMELAQAEKQDEQPFQVNRKRLQPILDYSSEELADHFTTYFVSDRYRQSYQPSLIKILNETGDTARAEQIRTAVMALLQSPAYNLC